MRIHPAHLIGFVILLFCAFVILREFVCWYFKINKAIQLLEKIANQQKVSTSSLAPKVN
jgi:hypothetical protein